VSDTTGDAMNAAAGIIIKKMAAFANIKTKTTDTFVKNIAGKK